MRTSDFDYELPAGAIAQDPIEPRDAARLLVHARASGVTQHRIISDLPAILNAGDLLVVNDTRVRPARLLGTRASGGRVEVLLLAPARAGDDARWRAFVRPGKRVKPGAIFDLEHGALAARAVERVLGPNGETGAEWVVELSNPRGEGSLAEALEHAGRMPLPPYIDRPIEAGPKSERDRERYQTVFASRPGAIAAPTAGLHFTMRLLDELSARGVEIARVTLHVGAGTFQPVQVEDFAAHVMHSEEYELPSTTVAAVERARARDGRVLAVGTTSARVLESCADESGRLTAGTGSTRLFITPGRPFRVVDALLTNFHLPRSTLLMLVSAFAGRERVLALYAEAIERGYRFYSYGDAMLLL